MNKLEQQIIDLIEGNPYLDGDLKKRYILTLFLMDSKGQKEYLQLWKAFAERCEKIQMGDFLLDAGEVKTVLRTVDEVKKELIQKIQSTNSR